MRNIIFEYIPYNLEENVLHKKIKSINKEKNLIIVQSEIDKNFFTTISNENKLKKNNNIISLDSFLEKIFFTNKNILKDIKRFMAFYLSISKNNEIKEKFNIKSYHDSIELADDFFEYYSHFSDSNLEKSVLEKLNLATWQKEKVDNFSLIKKEIDNFLNKNSYLPIDWLNKIENLDLYFLERYEKIIFLDVVDFPENFKNILKSISEKYSVEVILQIQKGDFNEKELKLEKISYVEDSKNIEILKYKNDFESYPHIMEEILKQSNFYGEINRIEDSYSLFNKNSTYLFNDSKLYKIIEAYVNLFEAIEINYKAESKEKLINLLKLKENIFTPAFMEFYGLDNEDIKTFDNFLANNYIYISLKKLKANYFDYLFISGSEKNENLKKKLIEIIENLFKIDKIKNINDLNNFFRKTLFANKEDKEFFIENKFSNIYDMFYEILGLLNTNENIDFFENFNKIFSSNLGQNIFLLFFNHLNNITLYSNNNLENSRETTIKNIYAIKNLALNKEEENIVLNLSANSLLKIQSKLSLFTEAQKKSLNLKTKEDLILYEKYRLYQNLISLKKIKFFLVYDLENNIDFSSFVYEFIEFYKFKEKKLLQSEDLMRIFYETYNKSKLCSPCSFFKKVDELKKEEILIKQNSFRKEIYDFERRNKEGQKVYQLRIGAYDYENLQKNETFFFLKNICKLDSVKNTKEITGFSSGTFGNILHKTMENLLKDKWKEILNSKINLIFERKEIEKYLLKVLEDSELKLEIFINSYFKEVLFPKLIKNIEVFLNLLYKEIEQDRLIRIEAEKKNWQETSFLKTKIQDKEVEVILTGRADFVMETDRAKYIIDFKTGGTQKNQLDFYSVMLFGENSIKEDEKNKKDIFVANYNFWEENFTKKIDFKLIDLVESTSKLKENILTFLESEYYIPPKEKDLKEDEYDFSQFYNYERICRNLINTGCDKDEQRKR